MIRILCTAECEKRGIWIDSGITWEQCHTINKSVRNGIIETLQGKHHTRDQYPDVDAISKSFTDDIHLLVEAAFNTVLDKTTYTRI